MFICLFFANHWTNIVFLYNVSSLIEATTIRGLAASLKHYKKSFIITWILHQIFMFYNKVNSVAVNNDLPHHPPLPQPLTSYWINGPTLKREGKLQPVMSTIFLLLYHPRLLYIHYIIVFMIAVFCCKIPTAFYWWIFKFIYTNKYLFFYEWMHNDVQQP